MVPAAPFLGFWLLWLEVARLEDRPLVLDLREPFELWLGVRELPLLDGDCRYPPACLAEGIGPYFLSRCG